jgi:non-canonical poly(A) RNA polymerase PAPD5/7
VLALHEEILDFCAWISASEEEAALRQTLIARVTDLIHSLWPHAQVMAFGSVSTNMYLPTRFVDCSLITWLV